MAGRERGGRTMAEAASIPAGRIGRVDGREKRQYGRSNAVSSWRRAESNERTPSTVAGGWLTPGSQRAAMRARRRGCAERSAGIAVDARDVRPIDGGESARGAPRR